MGFANHEIKKKVSGAMETRTSWMEGAIGEKTEMLSSRRKKNRCIFSFLQILSGVLVGSVPVLLGLEVAEATATLLKNVAIVNGGLSAVIHVIDSSLGAKFLWVRYTEAHSEMRELQTRFDYEKVRLKWTPLSRPILGEFKVDCVFVFDRHLLSDVEVSGYPVVQSLMGTFLIIEEEVVG